MTRCLIQFLAVICIFMNLLIILCGFKYVKSKNQIPLRVVIDLNIGESQEVKLRNGAAIMRPRIPTGTRVATIPGKRAWLPRRMVSFGTNPDSMSFPGQTSSCLPTGIAEMR